MTLGDISNIRLHNQQLAKTKFKTAQEIVSWMGAMQAQDYAMAKWAIGVRLPGSTENIIETAISKGEIIRIHLLRPTWHFVSSDDIHWLLELTSPRIKSALRTRQKELQLTQNILLKCNNFLENALQGGVQMTREEIISMFKMEGIATDNNRTSHIMENAEMEGIVCSGATKNKKQSYALLSERVTKTNTFSKEQALEKIAMKYFSSHGPATLKDFTWWSGLTTKDARDALEIIKSDIISENEGSETYWFKDAFSGFQIDNSSAFLLPAYDELLISYKDRTAALHLENHKKAVSENGIFRPVVVIGGKVAGLWKRSIKSDKVIIEISLFKAVDNKTKSKIQHAAEIFGLFLGKKVEVRYKVF